MMRKRGGFLGGRLLTMALACVLASSTCVAVAMGADTAPSTEPAKIATGGALLAVLLTTRVLMMPMRGLVRRRTQRPKTPMPPLRCRA